MPDARLTDVLTHPPSPPPAVLTLNSKRAWKVVSAAAGHYEYTDMALCAPRFLQAIGLVNLSPQARAACCSLVLAGGCLFVGAL